MTYTQIKEKCAALKAEIANHEATALAAAEASYAAGRKLAALQGRMADAFAESTDVSDFEAKLVAKEAAAEQALEAEAELGKARE